jgi:hypothetical protein
MAVLMGYLFIVSPSMGQLIGKDDEPGTPRVVQPEPAPTRTQPREPVAPVRPAVQSPATKAVAEPGQDSASEFSAEEEQEEEVDAGGDRMEYDRENGIVRAIGSAYVIKGSQSLKADFIEFYVATEKVIARGGVELKRPDMTWVGDDLVYNMKTGDGSFAARENERVRVSDDKVIFDAAKVDRKGDITELEDCVVTTCEYAPPHSHFRIKAKKATIIPGDKIKAKGVKLYFGKVPVLWSPYFNKHLNPDRGFRFEPGYRNSMGAFLLTSYRFRMNNVVKGETHFDVRSRRGVAVGQDFKWQDLDMGLDGKFESYYIADQEPIDDDEDPAVHDIPDNRYRVHVDHTKYITDKDYVSIQVNSLSDEDVLEDFFRTENALSPQPENWAIISHIDNNYSALLQARFRVDDFYTELNRLPEAILNVNRIKLGDSPFFYESDTSAGFYDWAFAEGSGIEDYDSGRIDSKHTFYYPRKYFGWLQLIPRTGVRGTYYTDTFNERTSSDVSVVTTTNFVVAANGVTNTSVSTSITTNSVTTTIDGGSDFRDSMEIGLEASFRAFKAWQIDPNDPASARRHIVEPFINWTFIPEPGITPDKLYQFDEVDRLDETHILNLGIRNKLQAKNNGQPFDLIDFLVSTPLNLNTEGDQDSFTDLLFDAEFRFFNGLNIDMDARYVVPDSVLAEFNTQIWITDNDVWRNYFEVRYLEEQSTLLNADINFSPVQEWTLSSYTRFEFEESELEEQTVAITRNFDCMSFYVGLTFLPGATRSDGTERDDDYRISAMVSLTEFEGAQFGRMARD